MTDLHTEAMKLALEALEDFADVIKYDNEQDDIGARVCCDVLSYNPHTKDCKAVKAITALREALAQELRSDEQPARQYNATSDHRLMEMLAQRKPLTDDEIAKKVEAELTHYWNGEYIDTTGARDQLTAFARAIESKLKEKNT